MNIKQFLPTAAPSKIYLLYGYTPFCGTCKLAERFLDITAEMLKIPVVKLDLNYYESLSRALNIYSVPVLLIVKDDIVLETVYRFQSVTNLYEIINKQLTD